MDNLQTSSSAREIISESAQPNAEGKNVEGTDTPAEASSSMTGSAPDVRQAPGPSSETETSYSIRGIKSMPEISVEDVLLSKEETVGKEQIALTTGMELSDKSESPGKKSPKEVHMEKSPEGSLALKKTQHGNGLPMQIMRDLSQTSPVDNTQITPFGSVTNPSEFTSPTPSSDSFQTPPGSTLTAPSFSSRSLLAPPNTPHSFLDCVSSTSMLSPDCITIYEKTPGESEPRGDPQTTSEPVGAIVNIVYAEEAEDGPSEGSQAPIVTFTESTPEMGAHITHVVHKTESFIERGLQSVTSVVTCAVPVDVLPPPEHRPIGSSALPQAAQDPGHLQVPARRSRTRKNADDNKDTDSLDSLEPLCDDTLGKCLVRPCPSMMPYRRFYVWGFVAGCVLIFIAIIVGAVLYDRWRKGL